MNIIEKKPILKKPDLRKSPSVFKLIIREKLQKKIDTLCKEINNIEWSGVLFYTIKGSVAKDNIIITAIDLLPMDIGNSTTTEFKFTPDVAAYMLDENYEGGVYTGLIHSHHNMETFFSSTDSATLLSEGQNMNHFLSLIVNNAGKYTARITTNISDEVVIKHHIKYDSFNNQHNELMNCQSQESVNYIEFNELEIQYYKTNNKYITIIKDRLKEIKDNKLIESTNNPVYNNISPYSYKNSFIHPSINSTTNKDFINEDFDFGVKTNKENFMGDEIPYIHNEDLYNKSSVDDAYINNLEAQLVTLSVFAVSDINDNSINRLTPLLNKRFENLGDYKEFVEVYWEQLISNISTNVFCNKNESLMLDDNYSFAESCIIYKVYKKLELLDNNNPYIKILKEVLLNFIID